MMIDLQCIQETLITTYSPVSAAAYSAIYHMLHPTSLSLSVDVSFNYVELDNKRTRRIIITAPRSLWAVSRISPITLRIGLLAFVYSSGLLQVV